MAWAKFFDAEQITEMVIASMRTFDLTEQDKTLIGKVIHAHVEWVKANMEGKADVNNSISVQAMLMAWATSYMCVAIAGYDAPAVRTICDEVSKDFTHFFDQYVAMFSSSPPPGTATQ